MIEYPHRHLPKSALHAYLDGMAGPRDRSTVEAHLAVCAGCRGRVESLRLLFSRLEALGETPMSRDLTAAVVGALRERERRSKRLHLALAAQTAAAVVVMALTWWSAGPQLVRQVADMLPSPTAGLGQAALGQLTVSWEGLLAAAEHWIESAISMAELLLEVLPVFPQWGSLLAAAGVLWLAVNGFIFRAIAVERRQRGAAGTEAAQ